MTQLGEQLQPHLNRARSAAAALVDRGVELWEQTPVPLRQRLIGAAAAGALVGFLVGTLAASLSASLVTSFIGALTWMAGVGSVLTKLDDAALPDSPSLWLLGWLLISVIGLLIQWTLPPRRADKVA